MILSIFNRTLEPSGIDKSVRSTKIGLCFISFLGEIFDKCFLNCLSLKESRLYSCRVTSNVHVLNEYFGTKFEITESDFLDIFKIKNKNEILEFIKNTHEFCKYCNFNSKIKFSKSKKLSEEWIFKS